MTIYVKIMPNGRMSLPASIRKRLGLQGGGSLLVEETDNGVVLRTLDQSVAQARAIAQRYAGQSASLSSADFISRRAQDSGA